MSVPLAALLVASCHASRQLHAPNPSGDVASPSATSAVNSDAGPAHRIVALETGYGHTCVALANGHAKCWGANAHGELGTSLAARSIGWRKGDMGSHLPAMCLAPGERAIGFGMSWETICVLLEDGGVRCFGKEGGTCRQSTRVRLRTGRRATAIAGGGAHACALLDDGGVQCWGTNDVGQLGLGDRRNRGPDPGEMGDTLPYVDLGANRRARAISAGNVFTCALLDDAGIKCWGRYDGLGLDSNRTRGWSAGDMGDALPEVDLGKGRTARAIASGPAHTCVILDDGSVKCWGRGGGELGFCEGPVVGDEPGEMGDPLRSVDLGTGHGARAVAAGSGNSCAILDDGRLKCWGDNLYGGLGFGDTRGRGCNPKEMGDSLPAVPLGLGRSTRLLALGGGNACVVLDDDELKCWGEDTEGCLGFGDGDGSNRGGTAETVPAKLAAIDVGE